MAQAPQALVAAPTKLVATGYGNPGSYSQYGPGQRKLMAMRAAQVDAYRNLAEQVYGFRVRGSTAVSAFATQSDTVRSYVDAFIRGARVVQVVSIGDENFEATVELDMSYQFMNCFNNDGYCGNRHWHGATACSTPGCSYSGCALPGCTGSSSSYSTY